MMTKHGVMIMTTGRVCIGTQQAVSLHQRNTTEGETRMTEICMTSSTIEMCAADLKIGVRSTSVLNRSNVKKGTITTMVPITTNLTDSVLLREGVMQEESRHSPKT
jgi:hypothetical protein